MNATTYNRADQEQLQAASLLGMTLAEYIEYSLKEQTRRIKAEKGCPFCNGFLTKNGRCVQCEDEI